MLHQLDAFRHVNIPVKSCRSIRMGKKEDLSEFEHGMMLGGKWAGPIISHTNNSRVYREGRVCRRMAAVTKITTHIKLCRRVSLNI